MDREFHRLAGLFPNSNQRSVDLRAFFAQYIQGYQLLSERLHGLRADLVSIPSATRRAHERSHYIVRFSWEHYITDFKIPASQVKSLSTYFNGRGQAGIPGWCGEVVAGDAQLNPGVRALGAAVACLSESHQVVNETVASVQEDFAHLRQEMRGVQQRNVLKFRSLEDGVATGATDVADLQTRLGVVEAQLCEL